MHKQKDREWVNPSGGINKNELPQQAAIREVREETGIELAEDDLIEIGTFTATQIQGKTDIIVTYAAYSDQECMVSKDEGFDDSAWYSFEELNGIHDIHPTVLHQLRRTFERCNNKIVVTNGCFDPVHVGHLQLIEGGAELGKLVIILNNDKVLFEKKGFSFMPQDERKEILEHIKGVHKVIIPSECDDNEREVVRLLRKIQPDYYITGGDKRPGQTPYVDECKRLNIRIIDVGFEKKQSSSKLIEKLITGRLPE